MNSISGDAGNFEIKAIQHPRYVDMEKCIACGLCAEKCPKKVVNNYDGNLAKRKAIYVQYPQAVPLKYAIDEENCIYFTKGKCKACEKFCPADAIDFQDQPKELIINASAVIIVIKVNILFIFTPHPSFPSPAYGAREGRCVTKKFN